MGLTAALRAAACPQNTHCRGSRCLTSRGPPILGSLWRAGAYKSVDRSSCVSPATTSASNLTAEAELAPAVSIVDQNGVPALIAGSDIKKGEVLVSVPRKAWIKPDDLDGTIAAKLTDAEPWVRLCAHVMMKRKNGDDAYLSSLPDDALGPVSWPSELLERLQGTQLLPTVMGYRQFAEQSWEQLRGALPGSFTFEDFLWAFSTVRSRTHDPLEGEKIALVPVADLVAHARDGNVKWEVRKGGLFGSGEEQLAVVASKIISAGEVACMDYAPGKPDSQVVLDYGVVDPAVRKPAFVLTLELPDGCANFDDKIDILELNGLSQQVAYTLRPRENPSMEMMAFLRLLNLGGADAFLLEALFRNRVWQEHLMLPVSEENERMVCESMLTGCSEALDALGDAASQDMATLQTCSPLSREAVAATARLGEWEVLTWIQQYFDDRTEQLEALEYYQERRLKSLGLLDDQGKTTYDWMD